MLEQNGFPPLFPFLLSYCQLTLTSAGGSHRAIAKLTSSVLSIRNFKMKILINKLFKQLRCGDSHIWGTPPGSRQIKLRKFFILRLAMTLLGSPPFFGRYH
ncbi:hypothetical protein B0O99DRAFT_634283, partial [Bisporella sp. PMI_857]